MSKSRAVSRARRAGLSTLALAVLVGFGCGGSGSGCSTLTPYPAGTRYVGPKNDNAVTFRLSSEGINYLNTEWRTLIDAFAPGRRLTLPVACTRQSTPVGDVIIADTGAANCTAESCGQMNGQCETSGARADVGASVQAVITGFALAPRAPDMLDATVQMTIDTGDIPLASVSSNFALCIGLSRFKCAVRFRTAATNPTDNRLRATVKFSIAQRWDKLLAFQVTSISGTQVCGASGAPNPPECLQPGDVSLDGRNTCGDIYCGLGDLDVVKSTLLELLSPTLQTQIQGIVGAQTCMACTTNADCPATTDGTNLQATCQSNVCRQGTECVPRFLGVEGTMSLGGLLGGFGAPADASLELSLAAGSTATVNQGMTFGTRAGIKPTTVSACVPPQAAPPMTAVTAPDFDGEAPVPTPPATGYHAGLGISSNFLNGAFWAAHQAGALCLNFSSDNVGLINTGLFKTFLPSLGKLATRDGKDAPMMVVLRPARPPTVTVGEGTYDPITKKPIKPLITVAMPDVSIDFYAMIDDRYARLFTLTADIALPLSLIFEGCDKVTPALGDVRSLITNIRTANAEILAEDPQVLADLVPAVIGLAEPALASGLSGFALPSLGSFKLKVDAAKGLSRITGTEAFNHLGLYAKLLPAGAMCAVSAPKVAASLKGSRMPQPEDMRLTGAQRLPWPEAVLDVRALGKAGSAEFSFRVDDGLWTDFVPVVDHELVVSHARFLLQGRHTISVRARVAEDAHAISAPVQLGFLVDWEPPEVSLQQDLERDRVLVTARDVISAPEALQYAYQVGTGAVSAFGPAREISRSAVEAQGGVTVLVRDEQGNVGRASWKAAQVALRPELPDAIDAPVTAGCSTGAGLGLVGLAAWLRRRRRA